MNLTGKLAVTAIAVILLAGAAVTYTLRAMADNPELRPTDASVTVDIGPVTLTEPGRLLFRNEAPGPDNGKVASVSRADPHGPRRISPLTCGRFTTSAGTGLCLAGAPGPLPSAVAVSVDEKLNETKRVDIAGIPSRATLSADGRMAAWTTFVTGDSYSQGTSFSTRAAIMDHAGDQLLSNIEHIPLLLAGQRHRSEDVNYWGVTFAADNRTFYATVATGGQTHLIKGDYETWDARALRANVECPSLSPDGTRLAFKKRVGGDTARPWREHVLDLTTMRETQLSETRSVDDQAVWLDDRTIAYALPGEGIWAVPADGSGTPRPLIPHASSLSVPRS